MQEIQDTVTEKVYTPDEDGNADETAVLFALKPKHIFVPKNTDRAIAPASDERSRLTAMLMGLASGVMLPEWQNLPAVT
eukprot:410827-Prymnesium_polylepis.1